MALFRAALASCFLAIVASMMPHQAKLRSREQQAALAYHAIQAGSGPDIPKAVSDARATLDLNTQVMSGADEVFEAATDKGIELLVLLNSSLDTLKGNLESMKSAAGAAQDIPFIAGTTSDSNPLDAVTQFVDDGIGAVESAQTTLTEGRQTFIAVMEQASLAFQKTANSTLDSFEAALTKMEAMQGEDFLLLVRSIASQSTAEEFWPFSSSKKATVFDQARSAIDTANKTVDALFAKVDSINGTIVQVMTTNVVQTLTAAAQKFQTDCLNLVNKDKLPVTFTSQAAGYCTSAEDTMTTIGSTLQKYTDTVPAAVDKLKAKLVPVRSLAATLLDVVDQAEAFATNATSST